MKPEWGKQPGLTPFFPRFRTSQKKKKRAMRLPVAQCTELVVENNRRQTQKSISQSSAYLRKLQAQRYRDEEIRIKKPNAAKSQSRRVSRLSPCLSMMNPELTKNNTCESFTKQTVVLPSILSKHRQQSTCSDGKSEVISCRDSSEESSFLDYHSEGEIYTSMPDYRSQIDNELYGMTVVPYKCRKLWSLKNKKMYYLKNHSEIPIKQTLALQLNEDRCYALDKHVQFINTSCISGRTMYRPSRMSDLDSPRTVHSERSSLESRLELMAIASVQEHNLPEKTDQKRPT